MNCHESLDYIIFIQSSKISLNERDKAIIQETITRLTSPLGLTKSILENALSTLAVATGSSNQLIRPYSLILVLTAYNSTTTQLTAT